MEDLQVYIILTLVICLVSTILVRAILGKARIKARLPPSPPGLPILGHLNLIGPIPHQGFQKLSNQYGPLIHISLGYIPSVVVSSPEMAKEFLKTNEPSFLDRPQFINIMNLSYPSADFTFAVYGPYWKFMRKICMSQLLGGQTLDQLLPIRREELKGFIDLMRRKADQKEAIKVDVELAKLMNNVISRMTMSQKCSEDDNEAEEMRKLVRETTELAGRFNLSEHIWLCKNFDLQGLEKRCKEIHNRFDAMMEKIIKEHEEARKKDKGIGEKVKDLVDILLDILEDGSSEFKLKKDHIKAFIMMCSEDDNEAEEIRKLVRATAELAGRFNLSEHIWLCKNFDLRGLRKRCKEIPNRFDAMMQKIIKEHEEARKEDKGASEKVPSPSIQMPSKEIVVFDPILAKTQLEGSFFQPVSPSFSPDEVSIKAFASSRSSVDRRSLTIGPLGISVPRPKNPQKLKYSKKHSTQVLFFKEQQSADCSKTGLQFRRSYRYPLVSNVQKHLFLRLSRVKRLFL